jgi:hypothetical protein
MNVMKYLLLAGIGVAAVLLLSTERAVAMRGNIEDTIVDNSKRLLKMLDSISSDTTNKLADLKNMLKSKLTMQ